ncbi:MAG: fibronectin type III domain-containing protein, partial [Crocinitomicaceae bacterium]|nr:fibronectin type III domain-containing protein [Crocinitomicaceae bacterium]
NEQKLKKNINRMKKSLLFVLLLFSLSANAQTTIFSENIGSGSGTQAITATTFQNTGFTFTGSGDTRTSTVSDYSGASGGKNVFLTNTNGTNFQIAGISTVGYTNLVLSFGAYKSTTASNMSEFSLQYSTDGSTYTTISIPAQATGTGTAIWRMISSLSLPVGANEASNLRLRWTNTSTGPQFRIDDITLTGTGPKYWDTNGSTAGVGGSATWGTTFSTNSGGTSASTTASSTDPTIFNATSGTVTLAASQTVASVTLGVSGYTFATSGTGTRTLTAPFSLSTFNVSFAPISGSDLTLPSVISGSGTITHSGTGVLELTAQNTYTGLTTVSSGTMRLNRTGGTTIPTGNSIVVNNGATMRISTAQQLANVTVDLGGTLIVDAALTITGTATINGTFQINSGGFASGGTWTYGSSSTLVYNHTGSTYGPIDSGHSYWPASNSPRNVTVQGSTGHINLGVNRTVTGIFQTAAGVTLSSGAVLTLNGTCQINSGGFFNQSPTYGSSSTLIYNTTYGTSNEWTGGASTSVAAGSGIPANVTVQSGTLTLGGARGVPGNITVNASTTLALNATSGDLYLGGNFAMNGTLTNNNRAVFFVLGNAQSISSSNANVTFDWLLVDKTGGTTITLGKPVIVNNTLTLTAGFFDLATNDMTVGATSGGSSTSYVRTSSTGQLRRIVTSSAVSFPVGNSVYNPITLTNSGTSDTYGIRVVDGNPANAADATKTVLRSWYITEAVAGNSNLTPVVAQYNTSDIGGSYAGSPTYMGFYNASSWTQVATTLAGSNPFTATSTGTNQFPATIPAGSYIAIGKDGGLTLPPPTITASGGVVASSPGSGTSGYVGNTVTINGTNLNSVTVVKVGGSGGTTVSILSQTATTLTFAAINLSGQIYVQNSGGNATSTETYNNLGYITTSTGAWSTAGTWLGGAVPQSATTTDVTIAHNVTSTTGATDVGKLTINGSTTLTISAATTVNINTASTNSGTITNNGTLSTAATYTNSGTLTINGSFQLNNGGWATGSNFAYGGSGTLNFNTTGAYTVNNGDVFWPTSSGPVNVSVLQGGLTLNSANRTVTGTFATAAGVTQTSSTLTLSGTNQLNSGGFFNSAPTYSGSATLIYNTTGTYAISNEWTGNATTVGSGIPFNVTIQNGTTLTFPTTNRGVGGNFNVASGGATLNATSGDLYVGGNFTNNGTFMHNTRAVFLNGTTQTLSGSNLNGSGTTNCFPFLILQNGTNVTLAASAAVTNTLTLTFGKITLSTFDLNLGTSAISGSSSSNYIVTNSTGQLKRTVTSSAVLFPVGNSAYNPITFTNAGTSDIYGIRVVDGAPANAANSLFTVQRSWYITEAVAGGSDLTPVVAQYSSGEVGANYNTGVTPYMGLYNGTSWTQVATTLGGSITATSTSTNQFPATIPAGSYIAIGKDAGLTSTPPTISSFTSTSGYSGSSIVITGTNFTGATAVSFGGTAAASFTVNSATQITAVVGSGGTSGSVSVTTPSGSVSLAGFTYLGFITTSGATNWNTGSSWLGGAVPTANSSVTIAHNVSIAAAFTNSPIASITVNTGITATASATVAIGTVTNAITNVGTGAFTFTGAGGSIIAGSFVNGGTLSWGAAATLNISAGGTLTNNGTFTRGTGTVNFVGSAGTINGSNAITFNNLTINSGELTLTTVPTIDGTVQLNGGFVSASPIYTVNSTLYYNLSYNRFNEWSATGVGTIGTTAGYPNNVTINTGTFDIVNGSNTARALNGTLTVNTGATFNVNALNAALTIGGGLTTVGTGAFNMGSTNSSVTVTGSVSNAGSLTLSSTSGSDLYVAGNFTNNGTFTHNTRAVFLNGTAQTISGSALNTSGTTNCFDYLFIQNNSQVTLGAAVAIRSNLTFTSGDIILSTFNLTLASGATITGASSSNYIITNNTGMLVRTLTTSTAVTFPIGNSAYNPITISQSGASDVYSFRMIDGSISGLSPNDVTRTINRRWSASRTGSSNVNITVSSISYNTGEENNATNFNGGTQPYYGLYNGTSWEQATATQASQTFTSANSVASSTSTSFSIAMGKDLAFLLLTPTITTTVAFNIATTSATSGGTSISAGGGTITSKGVAYATTANPTTPATSDGSGTATFSSSLSGLTPNTIYNYRAFATNSFGVTGYGSNLSFTSLHNAPTVGSGSGATLTAINANWTAPTGGGSATYTFEVAISTASDFSSTLSTQTGISSGTLTYQFTGLTSGTTYYFRVRANNAGGSSAWSAISSGYATLSDAMLLTALGTAATENFNTLASSGTSSTTPTGWYFDETDSNANGVYTAGTGSDNGGDTYSFGSGSDRAFGTLFSTSLTSTIGAKFKNNTGSTINNLFISYSGETWRVGTSSRPDRLDFQYSLNATSLTTGTWTDFDNLDYSNSGQGQASGSLLQSKSISDVITGLSIANGTSFWIRWNDFNAAQSDDGMGVDDFSIKPCGTVSAPTASAQGFCSTASATVASLVATGTSIQWYSASTGGTALATNTPLATGTYYV